MSEEERHDLCGKYAPNSWACWCESGIVKALHGKTIAVAEFTGEGWGRGLTLTTTDGYRLEVSEGDLHVSATLPDPVHTARCRCAVCDPLTATDLADAARATEARP